MIAPFRENFIFATSVKRHTCDGENSRQGHDLPISVNDREIASFRENFIFANSIKSHTCDVENSRLGHD